MMTTNRLIIYLLFLLLTLIAFVLSANAQTPRTISYQGAVTSGSQPASGPHVLRVAFYDSLSGGQQLYQETHTTTITGGIFNIQIGSLTPFPATLRFDHPYYLGVSIDGEAELSPRSALSSAPYALASHISELAEGLTPDAHGVVTSINELAGALHITGDSITTITEIGNTISIHAKPAIANGFQSVTSKDKTIAITNGNGPNADIGVADNAITTAKLADGSVTLTKLNQSGATPGQILKWNGTSWTVANESVGGAFPPGSILNSTLRWNGTAWVENPTVLESATGALSAASLNITGTTTLGDGTGADNIVMNPGTGTVSVNGFGQGIVKSNNAGVLSVGQIDLTTDVTGVIPVVHGGTGVSNIPAGQILIGNGINPISTATLTAGSGISITTAGGAITIGNTGTAGWLLTGNSGTSVPTNFLGTTDAQPFEIHVYNGDGNARGSKRVMRYEPNATSANLIGGYQGNAVTSGVVGATIAGGGLNGFVNTVTDDWGFIGGGTNNRAGDNAGSLQSAAYATVAGGGSNIASGQYSSVLGGTGNTASAISTSIGGGAANQATGSYGTVAGGSANTADAYSAVGGGSSNVASGAQDAIPGGSSLTLSGTGSFGFNGESAVGQNPISVSSGRVAVFGNTNLWLANTDNVSSQFRLYGPQNGGPSFPAASTHFSSLSTGVQTADIYYLLPTTQPTVGQVLTANAVTGTGPYSVDLAWGAATGNAWNLTGNSGTTFGTNFLGTTDNNAMMFKTDGVERMSMLAGGNIRIGPQGSGTHLPTNQYPPDSNGLIFSGGTGFSGFDNDNSDPFWIARKNLGNDVSELRVMLGDNATTSPRADFISFGGGQAPSGVFEFVPGVRIDAGGDIGVGTIPPDNGAPHYAALPWAPQNKVDILRGGVAPGSAPSFPITNGTITVTRNPTSGLRLSDFSGTSAQQSAMAFTSNGLVLSVNTSGDVILTNSPAANNWTITGNTGTAAGTNFLGTTDAQDFVIKTNSAEAIRVSSAGYVGIGTTLPSQKINLENGNLLLSRTGASAADTLRMQGVSTGSSSFVAGNQGATTVNYTLPTAQPTTNQVLTATAITGTGPYAVTLGWAAASGNTAWNLTGNAGTTVGTNYLGTQDNQPFEIHVFDNDGSNKGSKRVMRFEPTATSPNIIGGYSGNNAASGAVGIFIGGGGYAGDSNAATASYAAIAGGARNTAGTSAFIGGGMQNFAGYYTVVGGGSTNTASGNYAAVVGGNHNGAADISTFVGGGEFNLASGTGSFVGGGASNTAGSQSSDLYQIIVGGEGNSTRGAYSSLLGGTYNNASSYAAVGGGAYNTADTSSAIPGGGHLKLAPWSFGFNGTPLGGAALVDLSSSSYRNVAYFGGVNMMIGNIDNSPRQIQFYGPNSSLTYAGAKYSSFMAGAQSNTINYTLPTAQPTTNQVLTATAIAGTGPYAVTLGWAAASGNTAWNLTGNSGTTAGTNFLGTTDNQAMEIQVKNGATVNNSIILNPNGSIQRDAGGSARGASAVDLQNTRTATTQVASGANSFLGSGTNNSVAGQLSVIGGGDGSTIAAFNSAIAGGYRNYIGTNSNYSTIGGGARDTTNNTGGVIGGGSDNYNAGQLGTIGGGEFNYVNAADGTIAGGAYDTVSSSANEGTIGGGNYNTVSGAAATVGGGGLNHVNGTSSTISGGGVNNITGNDATIAGGVYNTVNAYYSTISGGVHNYIGGNYSTITGGGYLRLASANSFGFNAGSSSADSAFVTSANTAYFGNVNLWLGNTNNTASQLRFYEPQNGGVAFPGASTNFSSFVAGAQSTDINYTLPTAQPTANQVLTATAISGTGPYAVTLGWTANGGNTAWNLTGNTGTAAGTNFLGTIDNVDLQFRANNVQSGLIQVAATGGTGFGYGVLSHNTTGTANTAVGWEALFANTTGFLNNASGASALSSNTTGYYNSANGAEALYFNTTGNNNTANGYNALVNNTTGSYNTAAGSDALNHNNADGNTANGYRTLYSNTSGNQNAASGYEALYASTTGSANAAYGYQSLYSNSTGSNNTASGQNSLVNNTTGSRNTAVGDSTLLSNIVGSTNSALGHYANVGANNLSNATAIGANALVGQSNSVVLGSIAGMNSASSDAKVGIGTTTPQQKLNVENGNLLLSRTGANAADSLLFQGTSAGISSFVAGAQGATTINYTLPTAQPSANQVLTATAVAGAGPYAVSLGWAAPTSNAWGLTGNTGTTAGTNYLGTTDNQPFEIHVFDGDAASKGSKRVMRFEPNATSANVIAGYQGNAVTSGAVGAIIAGGGVSGATNSVSANYSAISGGTSNTVTGTYSVISGGSTSGLSGSYSAVSGGFGNSVTGNYSTIAGGTGNAISSANSFIGSGAGNSSSAGNSVIGGGASNTSSASATYSAISGGQFNTAGGIASATGGGEYGSANGSHSVIGGGLRNTAGNFSAIPGGDSLTVGASSFGMNVPGGSALAGIINLGALSNLAYFGNMDLWLGNTDNVARGLRFYPASSSTSYATRVYSSLTAGAQSAVINYTLPISQPTANQALSATAITGAGPYNITLGWATPSGGGWALTGNAGTVDGTNFLGTTDNVAFTIRVNNNRAFRIQPTAIAPSFIAGGGDNNVVSTAAGSFVAAGGYNYAGADYAFNGAGAYDSIVSTATYSSITGGYHNKITNQVSGITAGENGYISGDHSFIGGGFDDTITAFGGFVGGGAHNLSLGSDGAVAGGQGNASYLNSFIGGGISNLAGGTIHPAAAVVGGGHDTVYGDYSSIVGGQYNTITSSAVSSSIHSGVNTYIGAANSAIAGGGYLRLTGTHSFGFHAGTGSADSAAVNANSTAFFGNVNLWIGNTNNTSGQLRFYEPQNGGVTFPGASTNYSSFAAGSGQSADINYILPTSQPSTNQVLAATSVTGAGPFAVTLGWSNASGAGWGLTGNTGTTAGTNYLGTTDNIAFEIHVYDGDAANKGSKRVMRYEPTTLGPNIIGGYQGNTVGAGIGGATIAGGGYAGNANYVYSSMATIGGGDSSYIFSSANYAAIGGGRGNRIGNNGFDATIAGGERNSIAGSYSAIPGGSVLTLGSFSFGFNSSGDGQLNTYGADVSNYDSIAYFGNVDLWLGNTGGRRPRQLRFFQTNSANTYSATTYYSAFQAPLSYSSGSIVYTLPATAPVATGNMLLATSGAASSWSWSTGLVWDNTNSRLGVNTTTPSHPIHSINAATTDEMAAVFGVATSATTNQAIGLWGDASNTSASNTGTIGVLATGNGNTTASQTNVAMQINDGEFAMGRTTEAPGSGTDVEAATGGTAYSAQGPSGIVEFTLGATGNLTTTAPTAGAVQNLGSVTINNRYCQVGSIVLVNVVAFTDDGVAPDPRDAGFIVNADNTANGSFSVRIKMLPTVTSASNYSTSDKIRIGYMIVNKSR